MLEIDASAGGQVLRTSIGLSALLKKEVKIFNIRKNRPKPGLFPQHLTGLNTMQLLCNASVKGGFKGSKEIVFSPQKFEGQRLNANIGTAGSTMLLISQLLPPSLLEQTTIRASGGTDVLFAPSFNYFKETLFPALSKFGAKFELNLLQRGFYPKGGGSVSFKSSKLKKLKKIFLTERKELVSIKFFSQSSDLPKNVAKRQLVAAKKNLSHLNAEFIEVIDATQKSSSTGCSIDLIACFENGFCFGVNAIGEKGKPAQETGKLAAAKLLSELDSKAAVDSHLADQLLPFMALNGFENKILCARETEHIKSNIAVLEKFLGVKFAVKQINGLTEISVEGKGFF